jgi:hypothetical protein
MDTTFFWNGQRLAFSQMVTMQKSMDAPNHGYNGKIQRGTKPCKHTRPCLQCNLQTHQAMETVLVKVGRFRASPQFDNNRPFYFRLRACPAKARCLRRRASRIHWFSFASRHECYVALVAWLEVKPRLWDGQLLGIYFGNARQAATSKKVTGKL